MSARFLRSGVAVIACLIGLIPAAAAANGTNSRVTRDSQAGSYTRYDGGTEPASSLEDGRPGGKAV